jgi:hypothetical protein
MRLTRDTVTAVARRLAGERGFTMPTVLGVMLVVMLISVAAIAAASGDIHLTRYSQDDKEAYAAAEAGVNDYLAHLNTDNSYWSKCDNVDPPTPVNQLGATGAARNWRTLPDTDSRYSIELVPASGYARCDPNNPNPSMITDGNIKIRATGNVIGTNNYRTINATFRRAGFLDYLYYTELENQDPAYLERNLSWGDQQTRHTTQSGSPDGGPDLKQWAATACNQYWWGPNGRPSQRWTGQYYIGTILGTEIWSSVQTVTTDDVCGEIRFVTRDEVNGPFHSNDDILICGSPSFGRSGGDDRVEVSGPGVNGRGYRRDTSPACVGSPTFNPSLKNNATTLDPPATNASLKDIADPSYSFKGQTEITLNAGTISVKNNGVTQSMQYPPSGVIYVANDGCASRYDPTDSEAQPAGCGDVRLQGTYSKDLTIAAENDIVITDSVQKASGSDAILGLIPNGFVRIWHPVNQAGPACSTASNSPRNVRVDAAILTLTGSFTVDNYWCVGSLGTLTVNGAIAQTHRGVVGTSRGGGGITGYIKDYNYNETLRYRSPPHFLDPIQTSWRILRQGEQSPPARG